MIRARVLGGVSAEKAANNGEENQNQIERVPALLDRLGSEYCRREGDNCWDYNENECQSCDDQNYENSSGVEEERGGEGAVQPSPPAVVGLPERVRGLQPKRRG